MTPMAGMRFRYQVGAWRMLNLDSRKSLQIINFLAIIATDRRSIDPQVLVRVQDGQPEY